MMKSIIYLSSVAGLLLLVLALGCGEGTTTTSSTPPPKQPGAAAPRVDVIIPADAENQGDNAFGVRPLIVDPGTTVSWKNEDTTQHSVTSDEQPPAFDSGPIAPGQTFTHPFPSPGVFPYHCTFHPANTGEIEVRAPTPSPSPVVEPSPSPEPGM